MKELRKLEALKLQECIMELYDIDPFGKCDLFAEFGKDIMVQNGYNADEIKLMVGYCALNTIGVWMDDVEYEQDYEWFAPYEDTPDEYKVEMYRGSPCWHCYVVYKDYVIDPYWNQITQSVKSINQFKPDGNNYYTHCPDLVQSI